MNYLTTLYEHLRLFWRLRKGTKISDVKFVRCYLELFLGGAATKIPDKIKSVGFVSGARLCHEQSWAQLLITFSLRKKRMAPVKPEMFYITFDCYHLNPARTRTCRVTSITNVQACRTKHICWTHTENPRTILFYSELHSYVWCKRWRSLELHFSDMRTILDIFMSRCLHRAVPLVQFEFFRSLV
jgi:hypothetical protein